MTHLSLRRPRTTFILMAFAWLLVACSNPPPLVLTPAEIPTARVGQPYEVTIRVSGNLDPVAGVYVDSGALPEGLFVGEFDEETNTATISGTPTEAGDFKFVLTAFCYFTMNGNNQTGQQHYELKVE